MLQKTKHLLLLLLLFAVSCHRTIEQRPVAVGPTVTGKTNKKKTIAMAFYIRSHSYLYMKVIEKEKLDSTSYILIATKKKMCK